VATERDPLTGRHAYPRVVLLVPRRAGKSLLTLCAALAVAAEGGRVFYASAHRENAARMWRDDWFPLLHRLEALGYVALTYGNGQEAIRIGAGSVRLVAATSHATRGAATNLIVMDEARELSPEQGEAWEAAAFPTQGLHHHLITFLDNHDDYVFDKQVLELAAGLGLPSLVAAGLGAKKVCVSDQSEEAVQVLQQVINLNRFDNMVSLQLDWHQLPENLQPDVLLLSDINYDPVEFETLFNVLTHFLQKGTLIILSTPQRLVAKSFINQFMPWCIHQENVQVEATSVSIYVLEQS
jgi:predicted nicotinamide N-methyase